MRSQVSQILTHQAWQWRHMIQCLRRLAGDRRERHLARKNEPGGSMLSTRPSKSVGRAAVSGGALSCVCYFAACALTAAMSASLRSVITPIWLVR